MHVEVSLGPFSGCTSNFGGVGWGVSYLGGYSFSAAIIFEFIATFLFIVVILGSTQESAPRQLAGLATSLVILVFFRVYYNNC